MHNLRLHKDTENLHGGAGVRGCDYIFLCAPVITNIRMLSEIRTVLGKKTILTDVGSVKTGIHQEAERLGLDNQFIGGHPMTGSEKTGFESGNDHLFENAYYILTPGKRVPGESTPSIPSTGGRNI